MIPIVIYCDTYCDIVIPIVIYFDIVFDHRFCELFRSLDREVTGIVMKRESPFVVNGSGRESVEDGGGGSGSVAAEQLRAEIEQYKQFIRYSTVQ